MVNLSAEYCITHCRYRLIMVKWLTCADATTLSSETVKPYNA